MDKHELRPPPPPSSPILVYSSGRVLAPNTYPYVARHIHLRPNIYDKIDLCLFSFLVGLLGLLDLIYGHKSC